MVLITHAVLSLALAAMAFDTEPPTPPQARQIDLSRPFQTRAPWRLDVTEGPPGEDNGGNPAPGVLRLCLRKAGGPCQDETLSPPPYGKDASGPDYPPHYLRGAGPVYPQGPAAAPVLRIVTASQSAGDGGQVIAFQLLSYDRAQDRFARVYSHMTGTNNNEETRFVEAGPLRGDVISADPTDDAPFGYWMVVSRPTPAGSYRQVLRYRSATRYNDGNALAVIDSEMVGVERRLGVWRQGDPLPTPPGRAKPCPRPHLRGDELWCE